MCHLPSTTYLCKEGELHIVTAWATRTCLNFIVAMMTIKILCYYLLIYGYSLGYTLSFLHTYIKFVQNIQNKDDYSSLEMNTKQCNMHKHELCVMYGKDLHVYIVSMIA